MPEPAPSLAERVLVFLVCPNCGMGRKREKTGAHARRLGKDTTAVKGEAGFPRMDPAVAKFIDYRDGSGGRGHGFPTVGELTVQQAVEHPAYRDDALGALKNAVRYVNFCREIGLYHGPELPPVRP